MTDHKSSSHDQETADAFASSWNHLPGGSVYTFEQFKDWMEPLTAADFKNARVLELGCGNGSMLVHVLEWEPAQLTGVDLGDSVRSARENLKSQSKSQWKIVREDLVRYAGPESDITYCIGVLHHLKDPETGFRSVLRNTRAGGAFHCWVYAHEGNAPVRIMVEPLRRICCRLPWWLTKYGIATPLAIPVFLAARTAKNLPETIHRHLPLGTYLAWLGQREWAFARHVIFDQLVTPQTTYLSRQTVEGWLEAAEIDPESTYLIFRNRNSWKFGGRKKTSKE